MSDAENTQRNKELEADIKKLYPKIGYIKVNGVYQGSKEPSFLIYALGVDLLTIVRELGYKYEQDSVVYSIGHSSEAWLYFTNPLKSAFFEKKEGGRL
ncbi:DUF3293 domain-containing protein [Helicobacter pylori]|uniref:DUF3293 domain-containing protein n=1 Tax=Helicobacter pylori TaxID=210 RepID=UPI001C3006EC|nr:DUF3293 domain-containing protein [Helicobacter pylori]WRD43850.1 DUF3293 domain-containing protein [Helicobacter pylori]